MVARGGKEKESTGKCPMEKITKDAGVYYYCNQRCENADDAYRRFHDDYNRQVGKEFHLKLDYRWQRTERLHDNYSYFSDKGYVQKLKDEFYGCPQVRYYLLGLVGISYHRLFSGNDIPDFDDERFWRWIDWAFCKGSGAIKIKGRKDSFGRTSRNLNKRYR